MGWWQRQGTEDRAGTKRKDGMPSLIISSYEGTSEFLTQLTSCWSVLTRTRLHGKASWVRLTSHLNTANSCLPVRVKMMVHSSRRETFSILPAQSEDSSFVHSGLPATSFLCLCCASPPLVLQAYKHLVLSGPCCPECR